MNNNMIAFIIISSIFAYLWVCVRLLYLVLYEVDLNKIKHGDALLSISIIVTFPFLIVMIFTKLIINVINNLKRK